MTLAGIIEYNSDSDDAIFQAKDGISSLISDKINMIKVMKSICGPVDQVSTGFKTGERVDYNAYENVAVLIENLMIEFYEEQFCEILKVSTSNFIFVLYLNPIQRSGDSYDAVL